MKALLAAILIGLVGLCEAHTACAPATPGAAESTPERAGPRWVSMPPREAAGALASASAQTEPATPPHHLPLAGLALMAAIALRRHGSAW